jgi:hypothetical protein
MHKASKVHTKHVPCIGAKNTVEVPGHLIKHSVQEPHLPYLPVCERGLCPFTSFRLTFDLHGHKHPCYLNDLGMMMFATKSNLVQINI